MIRLGIFLFVLIVSATVRIQAKETEKAEFFENRVRPLIAEKCQSCHGREKQLAALRLDSKMGVLSGGENGPSVIAGQVDQSLLIQAVRREGLEMPPDERLSEDEVSILEKWVRDGAYWPQESESMASIALGDQEAIKKKSREHWSFRPLVKPNVPTSLEASAVRNPIDAFIASKLEESKVQALEQADKRTLLRRAYFDIIGIPPTAKAVDEFELDSSVDAFKKIVDRLLNSKEYGQRWGRYWLDVARYADSRDWMPNTDQRYPFAYSYRDYVIRSINEDKPYNQFLREQIAADLLTQDEHAPELAALGFLTVGPRFRNDTLEQISDRVDCISRGLMGLTVACARCHDHKYDPVSIEDFYALYGVFGSTELTEDLPTLKSNRKISPELFAEYEKERAAKVKTRDDRIDNLRRSAIDEVLASPKKYMQAVYDLGIAKSIDIRGVVSKHKVTDSAITALDDSLDRIRRDKSSVSHSVYGPLVAGLALDDKGFQKKFKAWLDSAKTSKHDYDPSILTELETTDPESRLALLEAYATILMRVLQDDTKENSAQRKVKEAFIAEKGLLDFDRGAVTQGYRLLGKGRKELGDLDIAIHEIDASHPGSPPRAMVLREKDQPITPFVFLRGEPSRKGERVPRRYISFFENGDPKPFSNKNSGRLELADKIVDPANPLTARVAVNRVWMKYFGQGLADSPDDFGLRSNPPLHPELLDWLAASFIENAWSMKWLHRTILNSAAYQRSSVVPTNFQADEIDADNKLLWRQNRRRLDFEATRDTMLAVSGELDRALDGTSVKLSSTPYSLRRSVYAYIDRVDIDPMLKVFDFASPLASASYRAETTIPQHSLFVMNHPFVIERAKVIADKVRPAQSNKELVSRGINSIFRRMLGRMPKPEERQAALAFVTTPVSTEGLKRSSPWMYGVLQVDDDGNETLLEFPYWTGQAYQGSSEFPDPQLGHARLTPNGGHPGKGRMACVRRFVIPAAGTASANGQLKHARDQGDGIIAKIIHRQSNGKSTPVGESWTVFNSDAVTKTDSFQVAKGDFIDLVVESGRSSSSDAFTWTTDIEIDFDGESSTKWSSQEGFKPPLPAMLDGWEQLAQALMLTNEFIYID
jgi:Protein of unknown function (DUF1553)/Protein of unknown function (DUF1549)/Planctomycete cytochrome C